MARPTPSNNRRLLSASEAYAQWAETYDTDGNPLVALDSLALDSLLPDFTRLAASTLSSAASSPRVALFVDLGCGTGRASLALLAQLHACAAFSEHPTQLIGVDASAEMLALAARKARSFVASKTWSAPPELQFCARDLLAPVPATQVGCAVGVVSTLVIEHVRDATAYFAAAAALLKPGGVLLATNMHPHMGQVTGAGFDGAHGKVRVAGYAHTVEEFGRAAKAAGFVAVTDPAVHERAVQHWMVEKDANGLGKRGAKWVGVDIWMGGLWRLDRRDFEQEEAHIKR